MKYRPAAFLLLFLLLLSEALIAQDCLPEGITFRSQAELDAFAANHPACSRILGNVVIEEAAAGDIRHLQGLSAVTAFSGHLEIHDNAALTDLSGLESVNNIGALNVFGNSALKSLAGLEGLTSVTNSLRIAFNHELLDITGLQALEIVGGDLTVSDHQKLGSLRGLDALKHIGGYLAIVLNNNLQDLTGFGSLTTLGSGLLVEENQELRSLQGLSSLTTIGGNCLIIYNKALRSLEGMEALSNIGGNLQIADNPFLADVLALSALRRINGLLLLYKSPALKSLAGLDSIDHRSIRDLGILSCDLLTTCGVKSICDYLGDSANTFSISQNGLGCNFPAEIRNNCDRMGQNSSPPRRQDPIFFPNPTGDKVEVKGEGLTNASFEVADQLGRILIQKELEPRQIDLSELAAGIYFVRLKAERFELVRKIVKQ